MENVNLTLGCSCVSIRCPDITCFGGCGLSSSQTWIGGSWGKDFGEGGGSCLLSFFRLVTLYIILSRLV